MNNASRNHPVHPEATLREANYGDLVKDMFRLGPAPNGSREAFVSIVTIVLAGAFIGITQPTPPAAAVIAGVIGLYIAFRWTIGARIWRGR